MCFKRVCAPRGSGVSGSALVMWHRSCPLEPRKNGEREKEESWRDGGSRAECKDNGEVVSLATTALWMVSDKSTTGYKVSD